MITQSIFLSIISKNFIKGQTLGQGKDGKVTQYKSIISGDEFALKEISICPENESMDQETIDELIQKYNKENCELTLQPHPNIVRVLHFFLSDDKKTFLIFMEKLEKTLTQEIYERRKNLNYLENLAKGEESEEIKTEEQKYNTYYTYDQLKEIIESLIFAFSYLQKLKIAHRDIKTDNLMFDKGGVLKIVDLGECSLGSDNKHSYNISVQGKLK